MVLLGCSVVTGRGIDADVTTTQPTCGDFTGANSVAEFRITVVNERTAHPFHITHKEQMFRFFYNALQSCQLKENK